MDKEQIALEITLKLIEKNKILFTPPKNALIDLEGYNNKIAEEAYNIYEHLLEIQNAE